MHWDHDPDDRELEQIREVEDPGPEPVEYRYVLIAAILIALGAWAWHALSDHASVLLK